MQNYIFVLMSFRINSKEQIENGVLMWFPSLEEAEEYLNKAGKPYPERENTYYNDPFEFRWNYCVIEKVYSGHSHNEFMSWWEAKYNGNRVTAIKLDKPPIDVNNMYNITGIG